ncbi:NITRATE FORMATE IRON DEHYDROGENASE [Salix purpurea]|uniref:CASP-like protein n=1 Tax=Salix purpurea TaxID=77065 RepID=A0A9Q0TU77_SALPP|nr:NITRATE FORMATE IRON DEHYDROGENASE [Salix purpurea]
MPTPPPSMAPRMTALILRVLTFAFLVASLAILTTDTTTLEIRDEVFKIRFKDVYSYRYMLAAIVFGIAYTVLQVAFTLNHIVKRNAETSGDGNLVFDFYGDKVISYMLATGAAAAIGATKDMKPLLTALGVSNSFLNKGYASASLLLLGFVCTAMLSVLSSYALPKKV